MAELAWPLVEPIRFAKLKALDPTSFDCRGSICADSNVDSDSQIDI